MSRLWWHRTRRVLLIGVGAFLALAASGVVYQSVSERRERTRFPPPGQLVDVGGRRLHLVCLGEGHPTVIFESSGFGTAVSSSKARTEVAGQTRVCSYDRMGTGWSDPGPAVISAGVLADDLDRLLAGAGVQPPYILVPASVGGLTAELFARRHPERVAGLVFVDAATSGAIDRMLPEVTWIRTQLACLTPLAARVGLVRLIDPLGLQGSGEDRARGVALIYRPEPIATLCGIIRGAAATAAEFRTAGPLATDVPLIVLSADSNKGLLPPGFSADRLISVAERHAFHEAFSRRSSQGRWQIVPGSTHLIASSHPHVVAGAALELVAAARRRQANAAGGS